MKKNLDLKLLKNAFKKYPEIQAVYLFGSVVSGNIHQESDLDLAIISNDPKMRTHKLAILSDLARQGFGNVDLVFLDNKDIVLQYEAVRNNRVIYQAPGFDRGATYSKIIRQYLDFSPYLAVQRQAYKKRIIDGKGRDNT